MRAKAIETRGVAIGCVAIFGKGDQGARNLAKPHGTNLRFITVRRDFTGISRRGGRWILDEATAEAADEREHGEEGNR